MQPGMASGNEGHGEGVRNQERRNFEQIYKELYDRFMETCTIERC